MKKKSIKKQKAPAYIFGLTEGQMGAIGSSIGPVGNAVGSVGTSIGNAADDTSKAAVAGSAFSGLGQGAGIGSQIGGAIGGPEGAAIGAQIGAVGGLVGGIFAGRKKRQQALARERRAFQAKETQAGLDNQAQFEQEYWNDNGLAYSFENGGVLPNVAWVDNNEVLRDNNGNIVQVPNTKPGTDNHLINSTTLESVLSDKLKRPGTNKTFAQEGEKLVKMTKGSKGKDRFAQAADKLNKIHANAKYEQLLAEQAEVKAKKGIKPKMKGVAPAYEGGTDYDYITDPQYGKVKVDRVTGYMYDGNGIFLGKYDRPYAIAVAREGNLDSASVTKKFQNNIPNPAALNINNEKVGYNPVDYTTQMNKSSDFMRYGGMLPEVAVVGSKNTPYPVSSAGWVQSLVNSFAGQIPVRPEDYPADGITGETILVNDGENNTVTPSNGITTPITATKTVTPAKGNGSKSVLKAATAPKKETTPEVRSTTPLETFGTKLNIPVSLFPGQIPEYQLIASQTAANNVDGITGETIPVSDWGIYTDKIPRSWKDPIYDLHLRTTEDSRYHMMRNYATPGQYWWIGGNLESQVDALSNLNPNLNKPVANGSKSVVKAAVTTPKSTVAPTPWKREFKGELPNKPILKDPGLPSTKAPLVEMNLPTPEESKPKRSFDLSALGEVIPLAANMFAKPEYDSQVFNPYAGAINRAMARRRMNIEPTLAANRRSRAISNRNLANINPNTGANLAARTQAAVSEYAQNADVYATRDNANNQYLADAANMMNNLGQQFAQNAVYTNDLNARNRAAARNFRTKSIENYNNWYQNRQLMKNQKERDEALYPILSDFLQYGIKDEYLAGLNKKWGRNK